MVEGLAFYHLELEDAQGNIKEYYRVLDDKNIKGDTLGQRRLLLASKKVPLTKLTNAVFFLGDLIKLSSRNKWFIDSLGNIFEYKKSNRCKLVFRKIQKIIPIPTGGAILEIEGFPNRFKTLHSPLPGEIYAGILLYGKAPILYGVFDQKYDDTWRAI